MILLGMIGPWQVAIVVFAIILLFGGRKIPELMKGIGQGMTEFKKARAEEKENENKEAQDKTQDKAEEEKK